MVLEAVLSGFVLALFAPWIYKVGRGAAGWILALLPIGIFIYFATFVPPVAEGETFVFAQTWVPSIDISLSFNVDGLSLLFAMIISGVGALVIIYAGGYLAHDRDINRFYVYILMFMASMLGVVLSDNVITIFIFWELTSITSFMLIGYYHEKPESRTAALQALLVTGAGGLALMAGLVMMALVGGSWEISELLNRGDVITGSSLYVPILILVLAGAFTKSAQFPFHFWLPNAMAAPTPVSTYLHSATMVKAGIYLMARFSPALGGTQTWTVVVTSFGAVTMLLAAHMAWQKKDLKQILAYSTVSALGILTMLLGVGTHAALEAALVFLVVHSMYKGGLFMVAGAVDHEAGTRDIALLSGLRKAMPITGAAAVLAGLSMSGIPPFFGFVGKELIYESTTEFDMSAILLTVFAFLTNGLTITAALLVAHKPFFGSKLSAPKHPHEAPLTMWLGPVTLGTLGLLFGLLAGWVGEFLIAPAVSAVQHHQTEVHLALWHGFSMILLLSLVTIAFGVLVYWKHEVLGRWFAPSNVISKWGPEQWYFWSLDGMLGFGRWQTRLLQSGYLRNYLLIIIFSTVGLGLYTLSKYNVFSQNTIFRPIDVTSYEFMFMALIVASAFVVTQVRSRLAAVAALGVVGYGVAIIFVLDGAPDLAMTQFSIETLSVILLVLVLYRLPRFIQFSRSRPKKITEITAALAGGGFMALLVLLVTALPAQSRLAPYFAENSYKLAHGHNVVNVILVDFRGFDTMGEITVLGIAAVGVFGLLKLRLDKTRQTDTPPDVLTTQHQSADVFPVMEREQS
ncbi:MAG: putative monovalent cation/H+ antiporter subunit A [Chloroflexi bacterium]|nr:MAG: putative monovalent cation/H+ antiporter subunit A [Chloroflexota bacterium]